MIHFYILLNIYLHYNSDSNLQFYVYAKNTSNANLIMTTYISSSGFFSRWLTIKMNSFLINGSNHTIQFIVRDAKSGNDLTNGSASSSWFTTTNYYIPTAFAARNYFISDFNINIVK